MKFVPRNFAKLQKNVGQVSYLDPKVVLHFIDVTQLKILYTGKEDAAAKKKQEKEDAAAKKKDTKKVPKKKVINSSAIKSEIKKAADDHDDDDHDDDDDDDESESVKITVDGVDYLKDSQGVIYDLSSNDPLGTLNHDMSIHFY